MSETTVNISDEVSASDDEEPNIDQLLTSSNWEKRLSEARAQRAKVLAKRGKPDTKPRLEALGFEPDQEDIAGRLVKVLQERDSKEAKAIESVPLPADDVPTSVPAPPVSPIRQDEQADPAPDPVPIEAPALAPIEVVDRAAAPYRRGVSILVSCFVGLGFGLALGFGLILGVDRFTRPEAADISQPVAPPAETSALQGLGLADQASESRPAELVSPTVQPKTFPAGGGTGPQLIMDEPVAPLAVAEIQEAPTFVAIQGSPVFAALQELSAVAEAQEPPAVVTEAQVIAFSPVPQPGAVVPALASLAPVQSQSGAVAAQFVDQAPVVFDVALITPGGNPQDGVPTFVFSPDKVSAMSVLPNALVPAQGNDADFVSSAVLSSRPTHAETKIPDGVSVAYNVPLSPPNDQARDVVPTLFLQVERVSAVTELSALRTPVQSDAFAMDVEWAETIPVSYYGTPIETAAVSDARLPFVGAAPTGETNLAESLGLSGQRLNSLKLYVHAPESVTEAALAERMTQLGDTGLSIAPVERESYKVSATHIRYYSKTDAEVAKALADEIGVAARDFTKNGAPSGRIEIYLAGTANKKVTATRPKSTTRRAKQRKPAPVDPRVQLRDRLVDALRRGDHL